MLISIAIALSIIGAILAWAGMIPMSSIRVLKGRLARIVGIILMLTFPALFVGGGAAGFVYGFISSANGVKVDYGTALIQLATYSDVVRAITYLLFFC